MEEKIIKRIRINKKRLKSLAKITKRYRDTEEEMIDSEILFTLHLISKIDEELTDIIYILLDNKNS